MDDLKVTERKIIYLDDALDVIDNYQFSIEYCKEHNIDRAIDVSMARIVFEKLPSAKEDEELGEWEYEERYRLDDETDDGPVFIKQKWWTCSKCGFDMGFWLQKPKNKYCPMCGDKKR